MFVVTALVARHLGAAEFGKLSYTLAVGSILSILAQFGMDNLVVRELSSRDSEPDKVLGTAFFLRAATSLIAALLMISFGYMTSSSVEEERLFFFVATFLLVMPFLIPDLWLLAEEKARESSISQALGQVASAMSKLAFVLAAADLAFFGFANFIQYFVVSICVLFFIGKSNAPQIKTWRLSGCMAKSFLREGLVYFAGSFLAILYLKLDVIMLRWMIGPREAGLYSVAAQLSEALYFVPGAILAAVFPALVRLRQSGRDNYEKRLQQIIDLMCVGSLIGILIVVFSGPIAIYLLFGPSYNGALDILVVHVFAMPFVFMGTAFVRWLLVERLTRAILLTQGLGAATNVLLNLILIPTMQGRGAALATVLSYMVAYYLAVGLRERTRPLFYMMSSALLNPWRSAKRAYALRAEL